MVPAGNGGRFFSMSTPNDGGPAFPTVGWDDVARQDVQFQGMSLRDWFAGNALNGWAAGRNMDGFCETSAHEVVANACYKYADAMLKARGK